MTDSAIGGVPTSGTDAAADGTHHRDDAPSALGNQDLGNQDAAPVLEGELTDAPEAVTDAEVADGPTLGDEHGRLADELAERTADLQRVSAEYANYRRRVDRDREATVLAAKAQIAGELLTVLDDVDRAATHGDLNGPFKVVADRLTETLERAGLVAFGAEGDAFDPAVHEAVAQETSADVTGPTVSTVMRRGYRFGELVLRPAMVGVTDADPDAARSTPAAANGAADSDAG